MKRPSHELQIPDSRFQIKEVRYYRFEVAAAAAELPAALLWIRAQ